jgi:Thioredoxin like C-terminal domain
MPIHTDRASGAVLNGDGVIKEQRLYQLIRQTGQVGEHLFSIEFLDDDVQAYSFTFG